MRGAAVVILGALGGAGCHEARERTSGTARPTEGGDWTLVIDRCSPVHVDGQPGVSLKGAWNGARSEAAEVIAVVPRSGEARSSSTAVYLPSDPREMLSARECSVYDVAVTPTGHQINDVELVRGHARLECRGFQSVRFTVDATFEDCGAHAFEGK
ncbi:MAG: hypothetical protein U0414_02265 [Polyangiaceae bacterium]